ncbi:MAG: hypothetical protein ACRBF0_17885 [Calditrichia bacterium]
MLAKKILNLSLLTFFLVLSGCYTTWEDGEEQPRTRQPQQEQPNESAVYIVNTSAAGITINLSEDGDKWREFRLESDKSIYVQPNARGELYMRIYNNRDGSRNRVIKTATLDANGRYGVYYDDKRKLFDIGKMRSRI